MQNATIGRRGVLGLGAAGIAAGVLPAGLATARTERSTRTARARNVIFVVVDGMSVGTFTLAEMMRDVKGLGPSHWTRLWSRPGARRAMCKTYSASGWVTDSAAAGSAWGIGEHIENGAVNFTPEGRVPEPILVTARGMGKATGLVTTTRLTHATPASFVANVPRRNLEDEIARQMLSRGVDVMLGGGAQHFDPIIEGAVTLAVARTAADLAGSADSPGRLLGIFDHDHIRYALDRPETQPSLAAMTRAALDRLQLAADGFVLQVEGGRVDHAAHANDAAGLIADQIDFDEALGVVADWAAERDDTLVIVTTDHGNANPGLSYYGELGVASFERLAGASKSFEWIFAEAKARGGGVDGLVEATQTAMGVELTEAEIGVLRRRFVDEQPVNAFDLANGFEPVLGSVLANHFGVSFMSPNHTSDLVEVTAFGPGSEAMPALIDNVDLYHMAMSAMTEAHARPWAG